MLISRTRAMNIKKARSVGEVEGVVREIMASDSDGLGRRINFVPSIGRLESG